MNNADKIKTLRDQIAAAEAEIARLERTPDLPPGWRMDASGQTLTDGIRDVTADRADNTIGITPSEGADFALIHVEDLRAFLADVDDVPAGVGHVLREYPREASRWCTLRYTRIDHTTTIAVIDEYGDAASVPASVLRAALELLA